MRAVIVAAALLVTGCQPDAEFKAAQKYRAEQYLVKSCISGDTIFRHPDGRYWVRSTNTDYYRVRYELPPGTTPAEYCK